MSGILEVYKEQYEDDIKESKKWLKKAQDSMMDRDPNTYQTVSGVEVIEYQIKCAIEYFDSAMKNYERWKEK